MSETDSIKSALAPNLRELETRAARAWTERMAVTPLSGGLYQVEGQSNNTYTVDIPGGRCTCPDHTYRGKRCKHIRRVAIEINLDRVPAPGKRRANCAACGREAFVPELQQPPLCADCKLEPNDVVVDRKTGDRLVVQQVTTDRADEYIIESTNTTVAAHETNTGYPSDDPVVEVVYLESIPGRTNPRVYAFPHSRLRCTDDAQLVT